MLRNAVLPVTVTVQKLNPIVTIVAKETIESAEGGSERTVVRFTLDQKGAVTGTSHVARSILQTFSRTWQVGQQP